MSLYEYANYNCHVCGTATQRSQMPKGWRWRKGSLGTPCLMCNICSENNQKGDYLPKHATAHKSFVCCACNARTDAEGFVAKKWITFEGVYFCYNCASRRVFQSHEPKEKEPETIPNLSGIPYSFLKAIGVVISEGERKYGSSQHFTTKLNDVEFWSKRLNHALRHLHIHAATKSGAEILDEPDANEDHLAKVAWYCMAAIWRREALRSTGNAGKVGTDDR